MSAADPLVRRTGRFRRWRTLLLGSLVLLLPLRGSGQEQPAGPRPVDKTARPAHAPITAAIRFTNDRVREFSVDKEVIRLRTPYGLLLIPLADIRSIDFATRIPEADARRAHRAVADLRSPQYRVRRAAEAELLKLGAKAAPALHRALGASDLEVVARARAVLNRLRGVVSEDQLEVRAVDVVRTRDSQIAGRIEGTALQAFALPLAKGTHQRLPLSDLRTLAVGVDPRAFNALADPGTLQAFAGRIGKTYWFKVTGAVTGTVWGTKVYTSDSILAAAAVHAGVLKAGQRGVVQVKIIAPPASYEGSTHNGVTSNPWGAWQGAYRLMPK